MSPLEQLRAAQHDDRIVDSDVELEKFLTRTTPERALADREPTTAAEREQLARVRRAS